MVVAVDGLLEMAGTAANAPDLGSWAYAYDNAGRLIRQADARVWITQHKIRRTLLARRGLLRRFLARRRHRFDAVAA
jgi:YD repeat-containing protein